MIPSNPCESITCTEQIKFYKTDRSYHTTPSEKIYYLSGHLVFASHIPQFNNNGQPLSTQHASASFQTRHPPIQKVLPCTTSSPKLSTWRIKIHRFRKKNIHQCHTSCLVQSKRVINIHDHQA